MATSLQSFSADRWNALNNATWKYFDDLDKQENIKYQAYLQNASPEK